MWLENAVTKLYILTTVLLKYISSFIYNVIKNNRNRNKMLSLMRLFNCFVLEIKGRSGITLLLLITWKRLLESQVYFSDTTQASYSSMLWMECLYKKSAFTQLTFIHSSYPHDLLLWDVTAYLSDIRKCNVYVMPVMWLTKQLYKMKIMIWHYLKKISVLKISML